MKTALHIDLKMVLIFRYWFLAKLRDFWQKETKGADLA